MASAAPDERDKPLWVTMAQSWLRLAEHADRLHLELVSEDAPRNSQNSDAEPATSTN